MLRECRRSIFDLRFFKRKGLDAALQEKANVGIIERFHPKGTGEQPKVETRIEDRGADDLASFRVDPQVKVVFDKMGNSSRICRESARIRSSASP
jgi:hypothetical protein